MNFGEAIEALKQGNKERKSQGKAGMAGGCSFG